MLAFKAEEMRMQNFYVRYCGSYLLVYLGLTILVGVVTTVLNIDMPSVMSLITAMVCAYYSAYLFVNDNNRLPDKSEKRRFTLCSFTAITVLSCIFVGVLLMIIPELREEIKHMMATLPAWGIAFIFIIVGVLYYFTIFWGFSQGAKMQVKALEKKAGL